MSRRVLLVGGKRHGEVIELDDSPSFKFAGGHPEEPDTSEIYTVCQAGDGTFYAVFEPSDNDPSVRRIRTLRESITNAMGF